MRESCYVGEHLTFSCGRNRIMLEENKDYDQIKLIDFGTSIEVVMNEAIDGKIGSPSYVAPEVL